MIAPVTNIEGTSLIGIRPDGNLMRMLSAPRRSSVLLGVAVAFTLAVGCSEGETFFPPLASAGAGAGGGAGIGGGSAGSTAAAAGNVAAGSGGGIAAGSGGVAATGGLGPTGGVGGASGGSGGNAGAGAGGSPLAGSPGTGGVSEGGQGNETGDAGEAAGGVGLGGSAGAGGSASGTSGSAGTTAGSAGDGVGGVAGTAGVGGAGTAGLGGAGASGGSAGSCGSTERCDGTDNDCDGDADEGAVCPVGCDAERYADHVYLLCDYSDQSDYVDYDQATDWCAAAGATLDLDLVFELARIESSGENTFAKAWIANTSGAGMIWLGANDLDDERTWVWGRGNAAVQFFTESPQGGGMPYMGAYDDFADGRPGSGNGADEDCGAFDSDFAWQWNDLACNRGRRGFLCEQRDP